MEPIKSDRVTEYRPLYTVLATHALSIRVQVHSGLVTSAKRSEDKLRERFLSLTGYRIYIYNAPGIRDTVLVFVAHVPGVNRKLLVTMYPDLAYGVRLEITDLSSGSKSVEALYKDALYRELTQLVDGQLNRLTLPETATTN